MKIGSAVRIVNIPEWLTHDLSGEDKERLYQYVGKIVRILEIQPHGYLWLSFADGTEGFSLQASDVQLIESTT